MWINESIGLLVVGPDRPYGAGEIEQACGTEVVGTLPHDPAAARVWTDAAPAGRSFHRSPLQRAAAELAGELAGELADRFTANPVAGAGSPTRRAGAVW